MTVPTQGEPGPFFWLGVRALTHVGEYRRYYALFVVWVLVMVAVPRTGLPSVPFAADAGIGAAVRQRGGPSESAAAAGSARPTPAGSSTFFADPVLAALSSDQFEDSGDFDGGFAGAPPSSAAAPPPSFGFVPPEVEEDPAAAPEDPATLPIDIPPPPPVPLPAPPAELVPLLSVVSPLGNTACSPIGLAGVVVALVGPSVEQVPASQIVPYLTPLYVACGTFPQTGPRTVCELDELYVSQDPTGGLLPPPAVIGLGIDTIAQLEAAVGGLSNQAQMLRQQLNCRRG